MSNTKSSSGNETGYVVSKHSLETLANRIADLEQQLSQSQHHNRLLRAVALAAQWGGTFDDEKQWCPICDGFMYSSENDRDCHKKGCPYFAAFDNGALNEEPTQ